MDSHIYTSKDIRVGDIVHILPEWFVPNWLGVGLLGFRNGPVTDIHRIPGRMKVKVDWGTPDLPEWINVNYVELLSRPSEDQQHAD